MFIISATLLLLGCNETKEDSVSIDHNNDKDFISEGEQDMGENAIHGFGTLRQAPRATSEHTLS